MVAVLNLVSSMFILCLGQCCAEQIDTVASTFRIEGKVEVLSARDKEWMTNTRILVDGGEYLGFLR